MGLLTERKTGWIHAWRNCGTSESASYAAFFTNKFAKVNIMYTREDLQAVINDPNAKSQIPRAVMQQVLNEYPIQEKHEEKAVA